MQKKRKRIYRLSDLFHKALFCAGSAPPQELSLRQKRVPRRVFAVKHERLFSYVSNRQKSKQREINGGKGNRGARCSAAGFKGSLWREWRKMGALFIATAIPSGVTWQRVLQFWEGWNSKTGISFAAVHCGTCQFRATLTTYMLLYV